MPQKCWPDSARGTKVPSPAMSCVGRTAASAETERGTPGDAAKSPWCTAVDQLVDPVASARMTPMVLRPGAIRAGVGNASRLDGVFIEVGEYSFPVATRGESLPERVSLLTSTASVCRDS